MIRSSKRIVRSGRRLAKASRSLHSSALRPKQPRRVASATTTTTTGAASTMLARRLASSAARAPAKLLRHGAPKRWSKAAGALLVGGVVLAATTATVYAEAVDYDAVRADIAALLDDTGYDDGSYGPVFIRLAWHACGTYNAADGSGGSDGATMRFDPEASHGANAGLEVARARLEIVKSRHPGISYSDLWQLAGVVAVEQLGGPKIAWRPGRVDKEAKDCTPDGRLPDGARPDGDHLRDIFYRMGFNDQEIVALSGAHALGRCHKDRSGFDGPWTTNPIRFSNEYYVQLLDAEWKFRDWKGPKQYEDDSKTLMMLPSDIALIQDPAFKPWVEKYAEDEDLFFQDFASAFQKLQENGVAAFKKSWYQFW